MLFEQDFDDICSRYNTASPTFAGVRNSCYYNLMKFGSGLHGKNKNQTAPSYITAAVKVVWSGDRADTIPQDYIAALAGATMPTQEEAEALVQILLSRA